MAHPDRTPGMTERPLSFSQVRENLRRPAGIDDTQWRGSLAVYGMIGRMGGIPKDHVAESPYGNGVASQFTVNPFSGEKQPDPSLASPVIVGYTPLDAAVSVQTMVLEKGRLISRSETLPAIGVTTAETDIVRGQAIRTLGEEIRRIASAATTFNEILGKFSNY